GPSTARRRSSIRLRRRRQSQFASIFPAWWFWSVEAGRTGKGEVRQPSVAPRAAKVRPARARRTLQRMRSEAGSQSQRNEASDRVGSEVVVTPCAAHESALVAVEERRILVGDVADVKRQGDVLERASQRQLLR